VLKDYRTDEPEQAVSSYPIRGEIIFYLDIIYQNRGLPPAATLHKLRKDK